MIYSDIVITECVYIHNEYDGSSAKLGLNNRTHCTGVQLKQVKTEVVLVPFLSPQTEGTLGMRQEETKLNTK